jgi:protein-tyrosine phosphatase
MEPPRDLDCYWVEQGNLLAGEYPGGMAQREARRRLRALLAAGVRTFVDLTEDGELIPYDTWLELEARTAGLDVAYHRFPVTDLDVPTAAGMRAILDCIDAAIGAGAPVYVHCWGGIGRTGTVVCCWLVERGRTCEQALVDIALLREGIEKRLIRSPEMEVQRQFVKAWTASVSPARSS